MANERPLDSTDHQILELLREDAWLTQAEIGEAVHLSASAVQRRIERLRTANVLQGAKAIVNSSAVGKNLRVYLLLELKQDNHQALEQLVSQLNAESQVSHIELLAGKFDILVTLDCQNSESFADFAMESLNKNTNVLHCWTLMRLKSLD